MATLAPVAGAQTLVGAWQGTLPVTENPRMILRFAKKPDGSLRGVLVRIDIDSGSIPITTVDFHPPEIKVDMDVIGTSFQGRMSEDGKSLTGTWTQDKHTYSMTLAKAEPGAIWTHDNGPAPVAMSAGADPAFEVATVKPSTPGKTQLSYRLRTRHVVAKNATVQDMVRLIYGVRDRQIEGAPAWMPETRFDIEAEPDTPREPNEDQSKVMLKKLLMDRFHLRLHSIQRTFPVYALTLGKEPPKIVPTELAFSSSNSIIVKQMEDGETRGQFTHVTMKDFANILMNFISDRQIVDETGLRGPYDFTMTLPAGALGGPSNGETVSPADAFYHATESQLGFKFVRKNAAVDVLVIDRLEMPTEN